MGRTLLSVCLAFSLGGVVAGETKEFPRESTVASDPPQPEEDSNGWSESLLLIMQYMCQILNCAGMSGAPDDARAAVELWIATYESGGVRTDLSPAERAEALGLVMQLLGQVQVDPGVLTSSQRASFIGTLDGARSALLQFGETP